MATKKEQKIRIVVKAFDHRLLDEAVKKIILVVKDSGATIA
jgi:ribosomal protein S10